VTTLPMPQFPNRLREAVRYEATKLWSELPAEKEPTKAQQVLEQLITNPLMRRVWDELYKKKRISHKSTKQYEHPACVTNVSRAAKMRRLAAEVRQRGGSESEARSWEYEAAMFERLEDPPADPRWSEQDRAVQLFLRRTYREYLDVKPVLLSDLKVKVKKFVEVAEVLRRQATTLKSLGKEPDAQKLEHIASDCDSAARNMLPHDGDDPWVITRQSKDADLRVFVTELSSTTIRLFEKELHSTLATVANVVFNRQDVTRSKVREMLRPGLPR
jgi:hypothetical protein